MFYTVDCTVVYFSFFFFFLASCTDDAFVVYHYVQKCKECLGAHFDTETVLIFTDTSDIFIVCVNVFFYYRFR